MFIKNFASYPDNLARIYLSKLLEFTKLYLKNYTTNYENEQFLQKISEFKQFFNITTKLNYQDDINKHNIIEFIQLTINCLVDYSNNIIDYQNYYYNSIDIEYKINRIEENKQTLKEYKLLHKADYKIFLDFSNSSINKISIQDPLFKYILEFLIFLIQSEENYEITYSALKIINKMMYFNSSIIQDKLKTIVTRSLFRNIKNKISYLFKIIKEYTHSNIIKNKKTCQLVNLLCNYIQFIQLLAENFNVSFHSFIFNKDDGRSLYNLISLNNLQDIDNNIDIKMMPIIKSIIKFLIEYIVSFKVSRNNKKQILNDIEIEKEINQDQLLENIINKIYPNMLETKEINYRDILTSKDLLLKLLQVMIELESQEFWTNERKDLNSSRRKDHQ